MLQCTAPRPPILCNGALVVFEDELFYTRTPFRLSNNLIRRERGKMHPGADEMLIPLVEKSEFELARTAIEGFEPWATYDDYLTERECYRFGLASAGRGARFAPVSVRTFLDWSATSAVRPTMALLDRFAAMAIGTASSPEGARAAMETSEEPAGRRAVHQRTDVAVDLASYREWLECLGEQPSEALLDGYVALVAENWDERLQRSLAVGDQGDVVRRAPRFRLSSRSPRGFRLRRSKSA